MRIVQFLKILSFFSLLCAQIFADGDIYIPTQKCYRGQILSKISINTCIPIFNFCDGWIFIDKPNECIKQNPTVYPSYGKTSVNCIFSVNDPDQISLYKCNRCPASKPFGIDCYGCKNDEYYTYTGQLFGCLKKDKFGIPPYTVGAINDAEDSIVPSCNKRQYISTKVITINNGKTLKQNMCAYCKDDEYLSQVLSPIRCIKRKEFGLPPYTQGVIADTGDVIIQQCQQYQKIQIQQFKIDDGQIIKQPICLGCPEGKHFSQIDQYLCVSNSACDGYLFKNANECLQKNPSVQSKWYGQPSINCVLADGADALISLYICNYCNDPSKPFGLGCFGCKDDEYLSYMQSSISCIKKKDFGLPPYTSGYLTQNLDAIIPQCIECGSTTYFTFLKDGISINQPMCINSKCETGNFVGSIARPGFSLIERNIKSCFNDITIQYCQKNTLAIKECRDKLQIMQNGLIQKCKETPSYYMFDKCEEDFFKSLDDQSFSNDLKKCRKDTQQLVTQYLSPPAYKETINNCFTEGLKDFKPKSNDDILFFNRTRENLMKCGDQRLDKRFNCEYNNLMYTQNYEFPQKILQCIENKSQEYFIQNFPKISQVPLTVTDGIFRTCVNTFMVKECPGKTGDCLSKNQAITDSMATFCKKASTPRLMAMCEELALATNDIQNESPKYQEVLQCKKQIEDEYVKNYNKLYSF